DGASEPSTSMWSELGGYGDVAASLAGKYADYEHQMAQNRSQDYINQAAAKFLGFENPVGETLTWDEKPYTIIGVIEDMIIESPYEPVRASLWHIDQYDNVNLAILKLNPDMGAHEAIEKIKTVFTKYNPESPFAYEFVDDEYERKFSDEERVGKLASFFAVLAIFISCLGIFGLASFVAEQRTKEIGVRKVMGASVVNLWGMLSKDFVFLVGISLFLAMPLAWYFMNNWLQKYQYRSDMAWWIFAMAGIGALLITLLTVSYQSIKAAMANPVNSLRSE
ncbi:MAG: FtsX-like permease family protein, partial [Cyclobacteriaceae bacterium]